MSMMNPSDECYESIYREFKTTKQKVEEDVNAIKIWLEQQPHLPSMNDTIMGDASLDFIIKNLLLRCKFSVEKAKQTFDLHFTLKSSIPEFFADRDPMSPRMQEALTNMEMVPLPRVTKQGYRVVIFRFLNKIPSEFRLEYYMKMGFMMADVRVCEDHSLGDIFINDYSNIGMAQISKMSLTQMKKMEVCIREGYRARVKGVHFINAPPIVEIVMSMVKTVMKSKMSARHHVHASMESLYSHVDKDVLPLEYGGTERSLSELGGEWKKKIESYRDKFLLQEKMGKVDESKRPGKTVDTNQLFGIEGTFRKLSVD